MQHVLVHSPRELKDFLTNQGVLFGDWGTYGPTKPIARLWSGIVHGEITLSVLPDGNVAYRTQKSCAIILRKRSHGTDMLVEEKTFANGTIVPPRRDYSLSEKCRFLKGETALEALARGINEELGLEGFDVSEFEFVGVKDIPLHPSQAFPTLLAECHKTLFGWVMPKKFYKSRYEEKCGYRTSTFVFYDAPKDVVRAHEARQKRASAA